MAAPRFLSAGESALVVEFGATIDPEINDSVRSFDRAVGAAAIAGIVETVPNYRSLMIYFDPRQIAAAALVSKLENLSSTPSAATAARHWLIPACYEPPHAEDLDEVADTLGITAARIVSLHASSVYRIYMFGFAPGYVFLGGLPEELAISRRQKPRAPVPQGSLLIAGGQALVANRPMPTGWYNIGATPAVLFNLKAKPPIRLDVGDHVTFEKIDGAAFAKLRQAAADGEAVIRQKV